MIQRTNTQLITKLQTERLEMSVNKLNQISQDFLSVNDVAESMHVTTYTIRKYCREGRLPAVKIAGRWCISEKYTIEQIENGFFIK